MDDLKYIQKYYGEKMMQLCRTLFPTILEEPGKLSKVMEESFAHSKFLYYDIVDNALNDQFKNYIYQKCEKIMPEINHATKTPQDLMREVGYELYECTTEEQIQSFIKYYEPGEELCTFNGGRLDSCYVFFAVREDAEKLNRHNFKNPRREDDYGISVISIQFSRNNYTLSIKNRYNHTVNNPDATYGNNLENIIPGLTDSFEKKYGFKINQSNEGNFEIPNYINVNGKFYKFNYEINNIYYCPNNIIIENGKIKQYPQEQYILMDYFMLDLKNKKIFLIDENIEDEFINEYRNIETIEIKKEENKKRIIITTKEGNKSIITVNKQNQIIGYENNKIKKMNSNFMRRNYTIKDLSLQNLKTMGDCCFIYCKSLEELDLPEIISMGFDCFSCCDNLKKIDAPKLQSVDYKCFYEVKSLEKINLPEIVEIGSECFTNCKMLKSLSLPKVKIMKYANFYQSDLLEQLNLPEITSISQQCFSKVKLLKEINMPKLEIIEDYCFRESDSLEQLSLPELKKMGMCCFEFNHSLIKIELPKIIEIATACFKESTSLKILKMPQIQKIELSCFNTKEYGKEEPNVSFEELELPEVTYIGMACFDGMKALKNIKLPKLETIGMGCFEQSELLKTVYVPSLKKCYSPHIKEIADTENHHK